MRGVLSAPTYCDCKHRCFYYSLEHFVTPKSKKKIWNTLLTYCTPSWLFSKCKSRIITLTKSCFVDKTIGCRCWTLKCFLLPLILITAMSSKKWREVCQIPGFACFTKHLLSLKYSRKDSCWNNFWTFSSGPSNSQRSETLEWLFNFKRKQNAIARIHLEKLQNLIQSTIGSRIMLLFATTATAA